MVVTNVTNYMKLTKPMLRKRFLEGLGSVKKFHSLTKDSTERESREKCDEATE